MIQFLSQYLSTILIAGAILFACLLALRSLRKTRAKGGCCGCEGCAHAEDCGSKK